MFQIVTLGASTEITVLPATSATLPTVSSPGRVYAGASAAQRQADRRGRFLDAALDLIGERGVAELTVVDVSARAGLSKRYFYEEFASLDALVDALMDDVVARLSATVFTPKDDDADDRPRARIAAYVHALTADPRLARLVLVETLGGGALASRRADLVHQAVDLLLQDFFASGRVGRSGALARRLAAYALSGATSELLVAWIEGDIDATADQVIDFLASLFADMAAPARPKRKRAPFPRR